MFKILTPFVLTAGLLLAACGTNPVLPVPSSPSALATDVNLIATGLVPVGAAIAAIPGVNPTTVATINADIALIQKDAAQVASATSTPSTSTVQEIVTTVEALASVATPVIPGGTATVVAIDAAASLAQVLLAEAGVTSATASAIAPITLATDRLVLRGNALVH